MSGSDQSFGEWLERKKQEAQDKYQDAPRSKDPRGNDIALGRYRAYRDAWQVWLERYQDTESDH